MLTASPVRNRSWARYQPTARRTVAGPSMTQRQRRAALVGVAHAPYLRKVLRPRQIRAELGEHAAAGFNRVELMLIADQDRLGAGGGGGAQQLTQVTGADHPGLIDND